MSDLYQQIIDTLGACRRVLITTHVRPDGDALGTAACMALALRKKNIDAEILLLSHLPRKYAFIFLDNSLVHRDVESGWPADFSLDPYDAILVVDTGTYSQLPGLQARFEAYTRPVLVMDHHLTQEHWGQVRLAEKDAAAAGEIAAQLLHRWNIEFDRPIAEALFLAIASDCGWFQFSNTRPHTMRLAADLMEAGVDTDRMYRLLYQNESPQRLALQTRAMQSLELLADGRLAVMHLRPQDFELARAGVLDTENLINIPLQVRTVEVSMLVIEDAGGTMIRASLRSKGAVDVAKFAEAFGGGGHARAAGLKQHAPFQQVYTQLTTALAQRLA